MLRKDVHKLLERGLFLAPRDASLWVLAADNLLRMQRVSDAVTYAQRALTLEPDNPRAQQILHAR